ncbi:hypothetical protein [Fibrella arboris]|uniref:hypothetical protein n=1 Tax=Fibrella arboris TaxID=3242486 RepID=UPI0035217354
MAINRWRPSFVGALVVVLTLPAQIRCTPNTQCLTFTGQKRAADCEFTVEKLTITGADPVLANVPNQSRKGITLNPNQAQEGEIMATPKFPLRQFTFTLNLTIRRVAPPAKPTEKYVVLTRLYTKGQNLSTTFGDAGTGPGGLLNGQFTIATPTINLHVGESQTIQVPLALILTQAGSAFKDPNSFQSIFPSLDMSLFLANPATAEYLTGKPTNYLDMRDLSEWSAVLNLMSFRR